MFHIIRDDEKKMINYYKKLLIRPILTNQNLIIIMFKYWFIELGYFFLTNSLTRIENQKLLCLTVY